MTIKNQFPFEIFVFGESIPFYLYFDLVCSGSSHKIFVTFLEVLAFR